MNPLDVVARHKLSSLFRLAALLALPLFVSACQSNAITQTPRDYLEVTPTQLSKYWVIQDSTLNWKGLVEQKQKLNISFGINGSGQLVDLELDDLTLSPEQKQALLARFSQQRFNATVYNKTAQPVRVSATVTFD
ncbi:MULTISPECIES: hypothetical protein [Shewanella]|uniref:hypothetical protein n=1 Tax=Shewanella TaxID=22 RepID=UPI001EFD975E|nr:MULTISPECIES: hypothetical protein [Shewanella]MCG9748104.1 hypothetical protein [Shewanella sp. Isolate8]MCL2911661.1 hypothetical protein [Shewanella aquimarina]